MWNRIKNLGVIWKDCIKTCTTIDDYIIFVLKFMEPEAGVKLYIKCQCITLS